MTKPSNLKDLLAEGHITKSEITSIARDIFDGSTTGAGPDGYVITAIKYDDLDERLQTYVFKAILEFPVENILDASIDGDEDDRAAVDGWADEGGSSPVNDDDLALSEASVADVGAALDAEDDAYAETDLNKAT